MKGVVACFTGLDPEERVCCLIANPILIQLGLIWLQMKLTTLIQYMHGIVSKVFTAEVTHLITDRGDPSSAKYRVSYYVYSNH